jgi:hypothetical protein
VATSPAAKPSRGRIGDGSANGSPTPRSDASQGAAWSSWQSCVGAGADGSRPGRSVFRAQGVARSVAFACVAAIVVLSLVPGAERPHTGLPGRAEHFIAYAGTGVFVALGYIGRRQRLFAWSGLAAASGLFELLQNFVPGRSPSLFDALASASGLTCGMAVGVLMTAALAWDRADGLWNANRVAELWRATPFRRRHRPEND